MRIILPSVLLTAIVSGTAWGAPPPPPAAAPDIEPDALISRQSVGDAGLVILDVRTAEEFAAGHVPGAINVPHDVLEGRLSSLPELQDRDVVVYCRSGRRSALALDVLKRHGYSRLLHLAGDMEAWTQAARPVERAAP